MKIKSIKKTYQIGGGENVLALDGVSFDLPQKGMVFILGKSGCGKSTLLNVMSGLDKADEGSIEIDGKDITKLADSEISKYRNSCCGFVFQEYNLIPELSVSENIKLSLELQGKKDTVEKVKEVLKQVGLEGHEDRKVTELSGGQKQRIAIARAIVKDPKIIFADEPTGALDEKTGESILNLLKEFSSERLVIVVTHDREFAEKFGDRTIELADGKVVSDSKSRETSEEEKESNWKKPKLPMSAALKIGCSNFKYHPIRLIATILLSVIAFTLLGVSLNFGFSQFNDMAFNAMKSYKVDYGAINKYHIDGATIPIKTKEKQEIEEKVGTAFGVIYEPLDIQTAFTSEYAYYAVVPNGFSEISENIVEHFGYSVTGRLPKAENEIALTEFNADIINELNFREEQRHDLIDRRLIINEKEYIITAIVDTHFDFNRYAVLKEIYETKNEVIESFHKEIDFSPHNFIFYNKVGLSENEISTIAKLYLTESFSVNAGQLKKNDSSYEIYKLNGVSGNYLPENMIPVVLQFRDCDIEYDGKKFFNYGDLIDELCGDGSYIEAYKKYKDVYSFPTSFECRLYDIKYDLTYDFTIDGFYMGEEDGVILSDELYQEIYEKIGGQYDFVFVGVGDKNVKQFISQDGEYRLNNFVIDKIKDRSNTIGTIKKISYILSGIFTVFAIIMLLNFMSQSVIDKAKIIGILKANGCNNVILSKIFIVEGIIIAFTVFVLVSLFVLIGCLLISKLLINIFGVNALVFPLLLAVISLFSALGSLLPIFRMRKYSPNDIIVGNYCFR